MWAVLGTMRALMQDVRMRAEAGMIKQQVAALVQDVGRLDDGALIGVLYVGLPLDAMPGSGN